MCVRLKLKEELPHLAQSIFSHKMGRFLSFPGSVPDADNTPHAFHRFLILIDLIYEAKVNT